MKHAFTEVLLTSTGTVLKINILIYSVVDAHTNINLVREAPHEKQEEDMKRYEVDDENISTPGRNLEMKDVNLS